ncbi:MAG: hypothetical protein IK053_05175, partial [Muribaculaceae bacterium]|nr:hypothetical protein [Muribaculaceae bacterium]
NSIFYGNAGVFAMVVSQCLARFGTANHRPQGMRAGFWTNRAKNPETHFFLARWAFGTIMQST